MNEISIVIIVLIIFMIIKAINQKRKSTVQTTQTFKKTEENTEKNNNILLLIELNDISHQQYKRRERDMKVKEIVKQADIKLINFYTDKPNKPEYVTKRIINELAISIPNYEINQIKEDEKDKQPSTTHQDGREAILKDFKEDNPYE